jgi:hypothetical protein
MDIRHAWPVLAAAVLSSTVALAQASSEQSSSQTVKSKADEMPITLVGCIQSEKDYRRANDRGRGGAVGLGLGSGDEFMLVNASVVAADAQASSNIDCAQTSGEAYELTGTREDELKGLAGRVVQINGIRKKAEVEQPVGTSGSSAARPTGGRDPLHQDLQVFEVEITSFQEVGPASAPAAAAPAADAPAAVVAEAQPTGTSGAAQELPGTASPLPLVGLIGLLSLAGGLSLRLARR